MSDGRAQGRAFRRILVGYDGSREAQAALRTALALGAELDGDVRVLIVVRPPANAETHEELERAAAAERENLSEGLGALVEGRALETRVVVADDAARALADHARDHGFDLVVVGSHGREHATHRGIGQAVGALLQHHPCPVLVV